MAMAADAKTAGARTCFWLYMVKEKDTCYIDATYHVCSSRLKDLDNYPYRKGFVVLAKAKTAKQLEALYPGYDWELTDSKEKCKYRYAKECMVGRNYTVTGYHKFKGMVNESQN